MNFSSNVLTGCQLGHCRAINDAGSYYKCGNKVCRWPTIKLCHQQRLSTDSVAYTDDRRKACAAVCVLSSQPHTF